MLMVLFKLINDFKCSDRRERQRRRCAMFVHNRAGKKGNVWHYENDSLTRVELCPFALHKCVSVRNIGCGSATDDMVDWLGVSSVQLQGRIERELGGEEGRSEVKKPGKDEELEFIAQSKFIIFYLMDK